jgi:hypothetical protein
VNLQTGGTERQILCIARELGLASLCLCNYGFEGPRSNLAAMTDLQLLSYQLPQNSKGERERRFPLVTTNQNDVGLTLTAVFLGNIESQLQEPSP